ncbi:MAG: hypothetical protein IKC11_02160 [Clostridia bacterium]|nr:hypothetical protein [Clostridia bacterium]
MNIIEKTQFKYFTKVMNTYSEFFKSVIALNKEIDKKLFPHNITCAGKYNAAWNELLEALADNQNQMQKSLCNIMTNDLNASVLLLETAKSYELKNNTELARKLLDFYQKFADNHTFILRDIDDTLSSPEEDDVFDVQDFLCDSFKSQVETYLDCRIIDKIGTGTTTKGVDYNSKARFLQNAVVNTEPQRVTSCTYGLVSNDGEIVIPLIATTVPENQPANNNDEDEDFAK